MKTIRLPATFHATHNTDGLAGYPAVDVFAPPGTIVGAPAAGTLENVHFIQWDNTRRVGGWTGYLVTADGTFFLTHFGGMLAKQGQKVAAGQPLGTVGAVPGGWWTPHIHEGLNTSHTSGSGGGVDGLPFTPSGVLGNTAGAVNSAARHVPGVVQVEGAFDAVSSVGDFLGRITDPHYILRGLQVLAGGGLVLVGTVLLARQVALAADLPDPTSKIAGAVPSRAVE